MPRAARVTPGGLIFHLLNRVNARTRIFEKDQDYAAFKELGKRQKRVFCRPVGRSLVEPCNFASNGKSTKDLTRLEVSRDALTTNNKRLDP
jgi:hypothetical protein